MAEHVVREDAALTTSDLNEIRGLVEEEATFADFDAELLALDWLSLANLSEAHPAATVFAIIRVIANR